MGFLLLLVCIGISGSTFDCNRLKLFTSEIIKLTFQSNRKGVWNLTCCNGNKKFMFSSLSHVESKCAKFYKKCLNFMGFKY